MNSATQTAETLRAEIAATEEQLKNLKAQLATLEEQNIASQNEQKSNPVTSPKWPLSSEEYKRYGRQMIVPSIGIQGQLRLKNASVLIVGAGGLGCPAAAYLAGAGVGAIGIVDGDEVETSNLHRQILHSTAKVGMKKVDSAISYLKSQVFPSLPYLRTLTHYRLNPNLIYNPYTSHLTPENSESIVSQYDLVLDCTDHPTSRYLISDVCVLLQKPLVSASALRTDGQLIVLNSPALPPGNEAGGPCYRCVFPKPPPAESVVSCGDGGILGPVVGVMGILQALEAIKLIAGGKLSANGSEPKKDANMLLFSANSNPPFRSVKLRSRRPKCFACSAEAGLTLDELSSGSLDYLLFCGFTAPVSILGPEERIEATEYEKVQHNETAHLLVDVRERVQFDICSIEGSINVPFPNFQGMRATSLGTEQPSWVPESLPAEAPIYVVCRLGNDSQVVTRKLKESGLGKSGRYIGDIKGGLKSWQEQVDSSWPEY